MKKKENKRGVCILCAAMLLQGCQPTTDVTIVTPKSALSGARMLDQAAEKSVPEQVQAPERCTLAVSSDDGRIEITVDADVSVPEADGIRLKKVETRVFNQGDMDCMQEKLLLGNPLWQRVYTRDQEVKDIAWTKAEIGKMLDKYVRDRDKIEAYAAENGWDGDFWERQYEFFCELKQEAPASFETVNPDTAVIYDEEAAAAGYWREDGNVNTVWGQVTLGESDYRFLLNNNWNRDFKRTGVYLAREYYSAYEGVYFFLAEMPCQPEYSHAVEERGEAWKLQTPFEDLREEGDALAKSLGLEEMELAAVKECRMYEVYSNLPPETAVNLIYTPVVDGIPVTYTDSRRTGGNKAQNYAERFEAAYDDGGLVQVIWENPAKIYDMSDEYVFLLPFSDILQTFRDGAADCLERDSLEKGKEMQAEIRITSIKLGYMWIPDESTEMEGMLIPVWDFIGSGVSGDTSDGAGTDGEEDAMRSFLTVNAMDGSIVQGTERPELP